MRPLWPRRPWGPLRPWGPHIPFGAWLSSGASSSEAALRAFESWETSQAHWPPFSHRSDIPGLPLRPLGPWGTQAARVSFWSSAASGPFHAHVSLESSWSWRAGGTRSSERRPDWSGWPSWRSCPLSGWLLCPLTHSPWEASVSHASLLGFLLMSPDSTPGHGCLKLTNKTWGWDGGGAGSQDSQDHREWRR